MPQNPGPEDARLDAAANRITLIENNILGVSASLANLARRLPSGVSDPIKDLARQLGLTNLDTDRLRSGLNEVRTSVNNREQARRTTEDDFQQSLAEKRATIQDLRQQKDQIEQQLDAITRRNRQLQAEIDNLRRNSPQSPTQNPQPTVPPNHPSDNANEILAKDIIESGRNYFNQQQWSAADQSFVEGLNLVRDLPTQSRAKFNVGSIQYFRAVCAANYRSTDTAARTLREFLDAYGTSNTLDKGLLANAQHLLALMYVKQGRIDDALTYCNQAFGYRHRNSPTDVQFYESAALLARIYELKGRQTLAASAISHCPEPSRSELQRKFASLGRTAGTAAPAPPATGTNIPVNPQPQTPASQPQVPAPGGTGSIQHRSVPIATVLIRSWLRDLGIQGQCPSEDSVLNGFVSNVERADPRNLRLALHIAALAGNVDVARLLIFRKGVNVNSTCSTKSSNGKDNTNVTPLHLAVAAQRHEMIRFLIDSGASLGIPAYVASATAPPRWLLSERWLDWMSFTRAEGAVNTIDTLLAKGWDVNARLNNKGEKMWDLAWSIRNAGTKAAVTAFLQAHGAH